MSGAILRRVLSSPHRATFCDAHGGVALPPPENLRLHGQFRPVNGPAPPGNKHRLPLGLFPDAEAEGSAQPGGTMMNSVGSIRLAHVLLAALTLAVLSTPQTSQAQQNWQATVGAQTSDRAHQALAFLPNELWIHAGDTITWTAKADDIHTVTFLTATQTVPDFQTGCPGYSPSGSSFDGSACISAPPL